MENQLVKINAQDYGLEQTKAQEIEAMFKPMLEKMSELEKDFNEVVKLEINPETVVKAHNLRLQYVKVRTGTASIHKDLKAFYLNGGRFVDGWKNAQIFASQGYEDKLEAIEKYYEILEKQRIEALETERKSLLFAYTEIMPAGLGQLDEAVFQNYLTGVKVAHQAKIDAELKAEKERIEKKQAEEAEREAQRIENLRLKAEAEKREKEIEAERIKQAAILKKQQEKMEAKAKADHAKFEAARKEAEAERKEALRIQAEKDEAARIEREKIEAENRRIQAELQAKAEAEIKTKQEAERIESERIANEKKAAKAPDKDKLLSMIQSVSISNPDMKTKEGEAVKNLIIEKLAAFKMWANTQVNNFSN